VRTFIALSLLATLALACNSRKSNSSSPPATAAAPAAKAAATPAKPFDEAAFKKISELAFPGQKEIKALDGDRLNITLTIRENPTLKVALSGARCVACMAMEKSVWEARAADLRLYLPEPMRTDPNVTFEVGETTVAGRKCIFTYAAGLFHERTPSGGTKSFGGSHSYTVYFNDGVNELRAVAYDGSAPTATTVPELVAIIPRDDLQKTAETALGLILTAP
jgi:hypothetical protein